MLGVFILRSMRFFDFKIAQGHIDEAQNKFFIIVRQFGNILQALDGLLIKLQGCFTQQVIHRHFQGICNFRNHFHGRDDIPAFITADHVAGSTDHPAEFGLGIILPIFDTKRLGC